MKILVSLHDLALGGTTVNAIELAAALRDNHGHEVVLFSSPGPMTKLVTDVGLRFIAAPVTRVHPSRARILALRSAVRTERPDLIHAWETSPCLDAYVGAYLTMGVPMVVTHMQMQLTRVLPKDLITTYGTPELVDQAVAEGRRQARTLLPPVDTHLNSPSAVDSRDFKARLGLLPSDITLVIVSRLINSLKGESLHRAIDVVATLGNTFPIRLLIVGDGTARERLTTHAGAVNAALGRNAVTLVGAMLDPRPAYAAADIALGMGGSALRSMAFARPTIVVGERGFSRFLAEDTADSFLYRGLYGIGEGSDNCLSLARQIRQAIDSPDRLTSMGDFARRWVLRHFSLDIVTAHLSAICIEAASHHRRASTVALDALRTTAVYFRERRFLWRAEPATPMRTTDAMSSRSTPSCYVVK